MNEFRKKRLESVILRELANLIIRRRQKDEDLNLLSITRVVLAPDFSTLKANVSLFSPDPNQNELSFKALQRNRIFFQNTISRVLRLRLTPQLSFIKDTSLEDGDRILSLIEKSQEKFQEKSQEESLIKESLIEDS